MAAMLATKVALQAVKLGTDRVPDKYWERIPGMRPPKNEQEYKETKAKVDKMESEHGQYGSGERKHDDKHHGSGRHREPNDRHRSVRDDRRHPHHHRRRSQSDERRGKDKTRDRNHAAGRERLQRRASSYSPPSSDDEFYNDAERRRQQRRPHKYHCNDPSHQQWERRDSPAYMARPDVHIPQPGAAPPLPPYKHASPPGSAGGPSSIPSYNPAAYPPAAYGQQVPLPQTLQGSAQGATPTAYAPIQIPPDSHCASAQIQTSFSPQASSPYTPASAVNSRPISQQASAPTAPPLYQYGHSPPRGPGVGAQGTQSPQPASAAATQPTPVFSPPPVHTQAPARTGTPGAIPPPSPIASGASSSKAAQKYTPHGVALGNPMYASP